MTSNLTSYFVKQYHGWYIYEIEGLIVATQKPALIYLAPLSKVEDEIDARIAESLGIRNGEGF